MPASLAVFKASADTAEIASALVQDGGVIIERLAAAELMDQVYDEIQANVADVDQISSSKLWPEGNKTIGALAAASRTYVEELLIHPTVLAIADAVLLPARAMAPSQANAADVPSPNQSYRIARMDDESKQVVCTPTDVTLGPNCHHYTLGSSVMLEVGHGMAKPQVLHRENGIYQPYIGHLPMREFIMSSMWAGTEFTAANGATRLVPGSHRWPEERIAKREEVKQAIMPKGSVVLWLSRTLHGAATNETAERRTGYFASYIADWLRQEENQYIAVPPEIAATLSPRAKQVIGYTSSDALGWVKGRDQNNLLKPGKSGPI